MAKSEQKAIKDYISDCLSKGYFLGEVEICGRAFKAGSGHGEALLGEPTQILCTSFKQFLNDEENEDLHPFSKALAQNEKKKAKSAFNAGLAWQLNKGKAKAMTESVCAIAEALGLSASPELKKFAQILSNSAIIELSN